MLVELIEIEMLGFQVQLFGSNAHWNVTVRPPAPWRDYYHEYGANPEELIQHGLDWARRFDAYDMKKS